MSVLTNLRTRPWATAAVAIGFATLAAYVALITTKGGSFFWDIFPWAVLMVTAAVIAFSSTQTKDPGIARNLLFGAAALWFVIGFVSIFSIGVGLLMAAGAAMIGAGAISSDEAVP